MDVGWFLVILVVLGFVVHLLNEVYEPALRRKEIKKEKEKEEKRQEIKRQNEEREKTHQQEAHVKQEAKEKQDLIQALKPTSDIVERAQIAQKAILSYPMDELTGVLKLLQTEQEISDAIDIFNERIKVIYIELLKPIEARYKISDKDVYSAQLDVDLTICMSMGRESVLKSPEVKPYLTTNSSSELKKSKIAKTHSWEEIKDEF